MTFRRATIAVLLVACGLAAGETHRALTPYRTTETYTFLYQSFSVGDTAARLAITPDGTMTFGPGYDRDREAKLFVEAVQSLYRQSGDLPVCTLARYRAIERGGMIEIPLPPRVPRAFGLQHDASARGWGLQ